MSWGGRCPRCGQTFRGLRDGVTMGEHRTEYYAIGASRRERCAYSGGTVADAAREISPLLRRTQEWVIRRSAWAGQMPTPEMQEQLKAKGLLEETLERIKAIQDA